VQESAPLQSPVWQLPLPPLKEHPMRPHTLPDWMPTGTSTVHDCPGSSCVPPPTGVAAGHTVDAACCCSTYGEKEQADDWGSSRPGRHGCCLLLFYAWRASLSFVCSVEELDWPQCVLLPVLKEKRERWSTGVEHCCKRCRVKFFMSRGMCIHQCRNE
jgi:hypothetical protein